MPIPDWSPLHPVHEAGTRYADAKARRNYAGSSPISH